MIKRNLKSSCLFFSILSLSAFNAVHAYTLENSTSHLYFYKGTNDEEKRVLSPNQTVDIPEGEAGITIYLRDKPSYDLDGYSIIGNGQVALDQYNVDINSGVFSIIENDDGTVYHGGMLVGQFFSKNGDRIGVATIPISRE